MAPCLPRENLTPLCYSFAWVTTTWRVVGIIILIILFYLEYEATIIEISAVYTVLSLITNLVLIYGMHKERPLFMLPYLVLLMFEMVLVVYCVFFGIGLLLSVHFVFLLPTAVIILGFYMYMWMAFVDLFHKMEIQQEFKKNQKHLDM